MPLLQPGHPPCLVHPAQLCPQGSEQLKKFPGLCFSNQIEKKTTKSNNENVQKPIQERRPHPLNIKLGPEAPFDRKKT